MHNVPSVRISDAFVCAPFVRTEASGMRLVSLEMFGMPRIRPEHEKCVFFLFDERDKTTPQGTGFFVKRTTRDASHLYAVTNHHVASLMGARIISVNTKSGDPRPIATEEHEWEDIIADDLSAVDITDKILDDDVVDSIPESSFITESFVNEAEIRIGEDVFLIGLFTPHHGKCESNIASGRFGSISIVASESATVEYYCGNQLYCGQRFVADMRARPGYSGSPVFTYRSYDLNNFDDGGDYIFGGGGAMGKKFSAFIRLLGVHCAQYPDTIQVSNKSVNLPGEKLIVPGAMTIVVPAWRITKLLNRKKFSDIRSLRESKNLQTDAPRAE